MYDLENNFKSHDVDQDQSDKMQWLREECKKLARLIDSYSLDSREKSLALTKLEECMFWANASVSRYKD